MRSQSSLCFCCKMAGTCSIKIMGGVCLVMYIKLQRVNLPLIGSDAPRCLPLLEKAWHGGPKTYKSTSGGSGRVSMSEYLCLTPRWLAILPAALYLSHEKMCS